MFRSGITPWNFRDILNVGLYMLLSVYYIDFEKSKIFRLEFEILIANFVSK